MRKLSLTFMALMAVLLSCSKARVIAPAPSGVIDGLNLYFVDSYHLNDTTSTWAAAIRYQLSEVSTPVDSGITQIPASSRLGDTHRVSLSGVAAGGVTVTITLARPFVIIGRKDDTNKARFVDTLNVTIPQYSVADAAPVDIWAYRPDLLVVLFNRDVTANTAGSLIAGIHGLVLRRSRSVLDGSLFYEISTAGAGLESEIKPVLERAPGVHAVYFNVFGHSYF